MSNRTIPSPEGNNWRKSRRSMGNGNCVEAASSGGVVLVRDTADRDGAVVAVPAGAWREFTARRPRGVCEGSVSGEFAAGFAADPCGEPAVWAWQPQGANTPVRLCDEHAAGCDLDDLEEL